MAGGFRQGDVAVQIGIDKGIYPADCAVALNCHQLLGDDIINQHGKHAQHVAQFSRRVIRQFIERGFKLAVNCFFRTGILHALADFA